MQKLKITHSIDSNKCYFVRLTQHIVFTKLLIINKVDYMHQLSFLYMLNYLACLPAVRKREREKLHTSKELYISKIENSSYYQEFVSHIQCQYVDELINLV